MMAYGTFNPVFSPVSPMAIDEPRLFDLTRLENPWRPTNIPLVVCMLGLCAVAYAMYTQVYGDSFSEAGIVASLWLYAAVSITWALGKAARPGPRNWLSPDVVFWVVFTLFHIPYPILYLLELADYSDRMFYAADAVNRSLCCVTLTAAGFVIGYELGAFGREQPARFPAPTRVPGPVFQAAQSFFLLVIVATTLALAIGIGPQIIAHGYAAMRRSEQFGVGAGTQRIVSISLTFLRIAIVVYLGACVMRHGRIVKGIILPGVLAGAVLFFALLGSRSELAFSALPILIGYHYYVKRIRLWIGIPLFVLLLIVFGIMGIGRQAESLSPAMVYKAYQEYRAETGVNPFVATLHETGGTVATVNVACAYIPSTEPYWYGKSFLQSVLMIIPSPIEGMRRYVAPSQWATFRATGRVGGKQAGWGSSIAMEMYINFGLIGGAVAMGVIGFVMRRVYDTALRRPSLLRVCFVLIAITSLAMWCRNYSHHFIRPVVWTMAVAWVVRGFSGEDKGTAVQPRGG